MTNQIKAVTWAGEFGDAYQESKGSDWKSVKQRSLVFGDIFQTMENKSQAFPESIIEVGAGCGDNLRAIDMIYERTRSPVKLMACDPNEAARAACKDVATALPGDLDQLPYNDGAADLVFTSGVLIHVPPTNLDRAMTEMYRVSKRWILSIEYFNTTPEEIVYRGETEKMWRRDWGEMWLGRYPDLMDGELTVWRRS